MDRQIVYSTAIPRSTDILQMQTNAMYALGYALQAIVGIGPIVDGLVCTPGTGLTVNVGTGCIIQSETVDQNSVAFGSLPLDSNTIVKIGLNLSAYVPTLTAPGTAGQSINYLIEAQLVEADGSATVLPYFNASNPSVPWAGPTNSGTSQNTQRTQRVSFQVKAGASAATGTQLTPGVDTGWVGLWVITVANGQSTISTSNIVRAASTSFIGTKLGQLRQKLSANLTLYVSATGSDTYGNGLSTSTAFATPQAAWNSLINNYDLNGNSVTISIGSGTFAALNAGGSPTGYSQSSVITISGAGATSTFLTSSGATGAVAATYGATISVTGLSMAGGYGLVCSTGCQVVIAGNVAFGTCTNAQIYSTGNVLVASGYSITGGAPAHFQTGLAGTILTQGSNTITGPGSALAFSVAFAVAGGGAMSVPGITFTGTTSFTGTRYSVTIGGAIATNGGGANYFPGTIAGVGAGTTGFYS